MTFTASPNHIIFYTQPNHMTFTTSPNHRIFYTQPNHMTFTASPNHRIFYTPPNYMTFNTPHNGMTYDHQIKPVYVFMRLINTSLHFPTLPACLARSSWLLA